VALLQKKVGLTRAGLGFISLEGKDVKYYNRIETTTNPTFFCKSAITYRKN